MDALSATISSTSSSGSIEVGDYSLCHHGIEACELCHVDFREDNTFVAGLEPGSTERASVKVDYALDKEGNIVCKQHRSATCGNCLNIKKQIVKLNKDAAKDAMKKNKNKKDSNFY